jgi:hypothetical protein
MKKPTINSVTKKYKTLNKTALRLQENIETYKDTLYSDLVESEQGFIKNIFELAQVLDNLDENSSDDEISTLNEKILSVTDFCDKLYELNDFIAESIKDYNTHMTNNSILNESISSDKIHTVNRMKAIGEHMSTKIKERISTYSF